MRNKKTKISLKITIIGLIITTIFAFIGWVGWYLDGKKHDKQDSKRDKQHNELINTIKWLAVQIAKKPIKQITNEEMQTIRSVTATIKDFPEKQLSADDYFVMAYNAIMNGDYDKAISLNTKAIELNPDYAYAYNNRGNAKYELKDYDGAIEDFNKAIELKPDYANAYNNRGNAKYRLKDYDGAIEDYNKAIELKPDLADAYYNRGNLYDIIGDKNKAEADFKKEKELRYK